MPRRKKVIEETSEEAPIADMSVETPAPKPRVRRARPKPAAPSVPQQRVVERERSKKPAAIIASVIMIGMIFGGAMLLGRTDQGQIDINAAIMRANEANVAAGGDPANNVPLTSNELRNKPNGGLVPQENQPPSTPPPSPDIGTTTVDGSEAQATSTDETSAADAAQVGTEDTETTPTESDPVQ